MKNILLVLLILAPISALSAAGSLGKPRFNNNVAFNEPVNLEISTLLPKVGINAEEFKKTIINAMDMPNNRPNWFLASDPIVSINDKSRFVIIKMDLLPRQTGTLRLPEIPMEWLQETKIPNLGEVEVREEIIIGNNNQPLPIEMKAVGGFPWDAEIKDLMKKIGKAPKRSESGQDVYTTKDGLEIIIRQDRLAGARIITNGWHLRQARFNFIDRWGEPQQNRLNSEEPHMVWLIGWLRIEAREQVKDGKPSVTVLITREDIENKLVEDSMDKQIFKLLESDQTTENIWEKDKKRKAGLIEDAGDDEQASEGTVDKTAAEKPEIKPDAKTDENTDENTTEAAPREPLPQQKKKQKKPEPIDEKALEELFKEAQENAKQQ